MTSLIKETDVHFLNCISQYMLILFLLFLIQFSIACACLAVNTKQQEQLAEQVNFFPPEDNCDYTLLVG